MKHTIEQLHLASQYLAAAGISFLDKKDDDSHTNFGWDVENNRLTTHEFGKGDQVGFNFSSLKLEWLKNGQVESTIDLQKCTHLEILNWFKKQIEIRIVGKTYHYNFHYELPYPSISDDHVFKIDSSESKNYATELNRAQTSFESFLSENNLASPIRVWPHHFDLGLYTQLDNSGSTFLGAGLAIPDTLVDGLYYYVSGYINDKSIVTKTFTGLDKGDWRSDWEGATLASDGIDIKTAKHFLNQTKDQFIV